MRSDWLFPLCTGEERLKGGDGKEPHPTQSPKRCSPASSSPLPGRTIWCSTRFPDGTTGPWPYGCAGAYRRRARGRIRGSGQRRIAAVEPMAEPALASFMTAREAPRVPFATLVERGLVSPGSGSSMPRSGIRRWCVPTGRSRSAKRSVDPPHRRPGAGSRSLQRLDLLARGDAAGTDRHRRVARTCARRMGVD